MTIAQSSDCVSTAYLIHFNPSMIYTDANLTKNHARISNGARKTYTMRIERAIHEEQSSQLSSDLRLFHFI
jgi:hypothetical protein